MRPEKEALLRQHIQSGRLLIGPWHILPDMFLVGPEAHIRNLLQGERTARRFGTKMPVGYIPDPFGHPGQVPQLLRGFGIEAACLWRGIKDEQPLEGWWRSPDGSQVFLANLRESYSNGAGLQTENPPAFAEAIARLGEVLAGHSAAMDQLIMLGTDHMQPPPKTSTAIAYANQALAGTRVVHSTLPQYIAAARASTDGSTLPVLEGELRDCKRMHLLPGVLSARMWIKQRNHASETLLTKWVEPFTAWQELLQGAAGPSKTLAHKSEILRQAWGLLMQNHPHDSICGCSVDQVHEEMKVRFDQVDQIGEELARQSLEAIAEALTTDGQPATLKAIAVFNPSGFARSETVTAVFGLPPEVAAFEIVDELGQALPYETASSGARELLNMVFDPRGVREALQAVHDGMIANLGVRGFNLRRHASWVHVDITMGIGTPDKNVWERGLREFNALQADPDITNYHIRATLGSTLRVVFKAPEVPGLGWRTFHVRAKEVSNPAALSPFIQALMPLARRFVADTSAGRALLERLRRDSASQPPYRIENEFFSVACEPNGTLRISDKRSGKVYRGLNRFVDSGDCGDEYNYSPPEIDSHQSARLVNVSVQRGPVVQTLTLNLMLDLPPRLNRNRRGRVQQKKYFVSMPITCRVQLATGVARVDVHTTLENGAQDHRLRVHFPAPFEVDSAEHDGHFEIVRRSVGIPAFERSSWIEDPRPEVPQRAFTDISNGQTGLMLANRGLPEVEVLRVPGGSEIALTLLRCVGWLSRDDFQTRRGHAGPEEATPGAQLPGQWSFEYAIIPHGPTQPRELAYAFEVPLRALTTGLHAGSLPGKGAFVTVAANAEGSTSATAFLVSAVKRAEDGRGWVIRGYNTGAEKIEVCLTPWRRFARAAQVNLAEQNLAGLAPDEATGSVRLAAGAHEIVTVLFEDGGQS
jgi:alpha-mannosidase